MRPAEGTPFGAVADRLVRHFAPRCLPSCEFECALGIEPMHRAARCAPRSLAEAGGARWNDRARRRDFPLRGERGCVEDELDGVLGGLHGDVWAVV